MVGVFGCEKSVRHSTSPLAGSLNDSVWMLEITVGGRTIGLAFGMGIFWVYELVRMFIEGLGDYRSVLGNDGYVFGVFWIC